MTSVVRPSQPGVLYACPCCRFLTFPERGGYDICPVCFWEDDGQDNHDAHVVRDGSNYELSLEVARRNYLAFGACDPRSREYVRAPSADEASHPGDRVMELPYLRLTEGEGRLLLRVEDAEVSDFIEDYLTEECDFSDLLLSFGAASEIIFPEGVEAKSIVACLRRLDAGELDRIFRINHPDARNECR